MREEIGDRFFVLARGLGIEHHGENFEKVVALH
jgi:hypothetical protein